MKKLLALVTALLLVPAAFAEAPEEPLLQVHQLMIGFVGRAEDTGFRLSSEVAQARWVPVREALEQVHPKGSISYALIELYLQGTDA